MPPPAQFLSKYVFFTDPTYATTTLALVRVSSGGAFQDVTLDCVGKVGGWQPVGAGGKYQVTTVDLLRGGVANGSCANGHHLATSAGPLGLVVWGMQQGESYAYAAGGNAAALNQVVVPPVIQ
jgi:hypothetical protein